MVWREESVTDNQRTALDAAEAAEIARHFDTLLSDLAADQSMAARAEMRKRLAVGLTLAAQARKLLEEAFGV